MGKQRHIRAAPILVSLAATCCVTLTLCLSRSIKAEAYIRLSVVCVHLLENSYSGSQEEGSCCQLWELCPSLLGGAPNHVMGDRGCFSRHKNTGQTAASFYWCEVLRNPLIGPSHNWSEGHREGA